MTVKWYLSVLQIVQDQLVCVAKVQWKGLALPNVTCA